MKQYDQQTLKKLHTFEVAMLQDFIQVCEKYNIPYFAVFGTLLGAVRHKGFIPWDDDLDVGMLRKDYERFLEVFPNELGKEYRILNTGVDEGYTCSVTHFGKKGTVFVPEHAKRMKCEQNICFDIFIFDSVADEEKARKKQLRKGWFWSKLLFLRGTPYPIIPLEGMQKKSRYRGVFFDPLWLAPIPCQGGVYLSENGTKCPAIQWGRPSNQADHILPG